MTRKWHVCAESILPARKLQKGNWAGKVQEEYFNIAVDHVAQIAHQRQMSVK